MAIQSNNAKCSITRSKFVYEEFIFKVLILASFFGFRTQAVRWYAVEEIHGERCEEHVQCLWNHRRVFGAKGQHREE